MLKKRVIPALLLKEGRVVKGVKFSNFRDTGHPVTAAKVYEAQGADELVFLDISASQQNRHILLGIVKETAEECFMPLTVGGGIRSIDDIQRLLKIGADKVSINTAGVERPQLITEASRQFGRQCIVITIDAKKTQNGRYEVMTHGGQKPTGKDVIEWAKEATAKGAGEILINSIDRDGTMQGYDIKLVKSVVDAVSVPVIAGSGAGNLEHLLQALVEGGASAVLVASLFHFTDQSIIKAKTYLRQKGIDVRDI